MSEMVEEAFVRLARLVDALLVDFATRDVVFRPLVAEDDAISGA